MGLGRVRMFFAGRFPGMNEIVAASKQGGRGRVYSSMKREYTQAVALTALGYRKKLPGRVKLEFHWFEANKKRDPDNIVAAKKFILDGLVEAGVLTGDGWGVVESFLDTWGVGAPGVIVTIEDLEEA